MTDMPPWSLTVTVDRPDDKPLVGCLLRVDVERGRLFPGGPPGVLKELVELMSPTGDTLVSIEAPPLHRGELRPWFVILQTHGPAVKKAGYYPRVALLHPDLQETGLSAGAGGWIRGTNYRFDDPVRTLPTGEDSEATC